MHTDLPNEPKPQASAPTRRSFLGTLVGLISAVVGATLAIPLMRFILPRPSVKEAGSEWSAIGPIEDFASLDGPVKRLVTLTQVDGWRKVISEKPLYVLKGADGSFRVLSSVCPHLGCSVAWNAASSHFLCPCHGGVFSADGAHLSGPPPRGLDAMECRVEDGNLMVRYQIFRQLVKSKEVMA